MIYLQRTSRPTNPLTKVAIGAATVFIVGAILLQLFAPSFFPSVLHTLGLPLWRSNAAVGVSFSNFFGLLNSKRALILSNRDLKAKLEETQLRLTAQIALQDEYLKLKALFEGEGRKDAIIAAVLARPNVSVYDTLVIDAGTSEGVVAGDEVLVAENIMIGTVDHVFAHSAVVKLFSTPGESTLVEIGPQKIQTTAEGRGGGNFEARLPRGVEVAEGDSIIIPSIDPKLFAVVEKINVAPSDPFQVILFKSPVNLFEVEYVEIYPKH